MTEERTRVSIPLGGGINQDEAAWLVRPPFAAELQNLTFKGSGYRKRDGWTRVTPSVGATEGVMLVPQKDALGVMLADGMKVLKGATLESQAYGGQIPLRATSHPVYVSRGAVSGAQIAHNNGATAVIFTEADEEFNRTAVVVVLNSNFEVVYGPARYVELAHGPRVEPCDTGFLFFGVSDDTISVTASAVTGTLQSLYVAGDGSGTAGPVSMVSITATPASASVRGWFYDSHGVAGQAAAYVAYHDATNLRLLAVGTSATVTGSQTVRTEGPENPAVWHNPTTQSVLVWSGDNQNIYCLRDDMSGTGTTNALATLSVALQYTPTFYETGNGHLYLSNRRVTITGTNPGTPSVAAAISLTPKLGRNPQPRGAGASAFYFRTFTYGEGPGNDADNQFGDELVSGGERITASDIGSSIVDRDVVVPHASQYDLWYMHHMHMYHVNDAGTAAYWFLGVRGQSARSSDSILLPNIIVNGAYTAPPLWTADDKTVSDVGGSVSTYWNAGTYRHANFGIDPTIAEAPTPTWDVVHRVGGAGVNEGVSRVAISKINTQDVQGSVADLNGSMLVAAGALYVFDGVSNLPAVLEGPEGATWTIPPKYALIENAAMPPADLYASEPLSILNDKKVNFKGVLFRIDRNGVKYRSDVFELGSITNGTAGREEYFPRWTLRLPPSARNLVEGGSSLSLEIYASDEHDSAGDPSEFTLAWRGPLVYQAGSDNYLADASNFYNVTGWGGVGPAGSAAHEGSRLMNPTTPYTDAELGPQLPPASNVIAHAGNYIFLLPSENPWEVWHTKPLSSFIGPEFNSTLTVRMPAESGGCVSLAGEGDRILFLCKNGVWELFVAGEGPNVLGEGSFPPLRKVFAGNGCISHACTVTGPFGTFFVSQDGPMIIGRDGQVAEIGDFIGDVPVTSFTHATYNPAEKEIWLSTGSANYILDVGRMQWSYATFANIASAVKDRTLYRVDAGGALLYEDSTAYSNGATATYFLAKWVSGWLSFEPTMGFVRVKRLSVLVQPNLASSGLLRIKLAYDYVSTDIDTFEFDISDVAALDKPIQLTVRPTRQKCDALRITVEDAEEFTSKLNVSRWTLVGVDLEVQGKGGSIRLQQEARS